MTERINQLAEFLLQFDALKTVNRKSYIKGGERVENSAEHSWHLAMACWAFAEELQQGFDVLRLIKLTLVHDIGEIDAGDTFLYSEHRAEAHIAERQCVERIAAHPGNPIKNFAALWDEQEIGQSKEAKLLKVIDRLLPFLHNITSEGRAWRDHNIHKDQVLKMHQFVQHESPEIYAWVISKVEYAVERGWLRS